MPNWAARAASRPGVRSRVAGVDTVDRNPVAAQLYRQGLGHVYHGTVARSAAEIAGVTGVGAADVDDAAPTLLFQVGNNGAGAAQRPHILHVEVMQQILIDHGFNGAGSGS